MTSAAKLKAIEQKLRSKLSSSRFAHCQRVAKESQKIAQLISFDPQRAYLAGLLHDLGKELSDTDILKLANKNRLRLSSLNRHKPQTLHSQVGAILARTQFQITDNQVLRAIAHHTFGHSRMCTLEKIIFVADYIEDGREHPAALKIKHKLHATGELNAAVVSKAKSMIEYARLQKWPLHRSLRCLARKKQ